MIMRMMIRGRGLHGRRSVRNWGSENYECRRKRKRKRKRRRRRRKRKKRKERRKGKRKR